jgi:putative glycosyltransferase (TIGR04372 family)
MDNAYARRWIGLGDRPDAPFRILAPLVGRDVKSLDQVIAFASQMAAVFKYSETKFLADRGSISLEHIAALHSQPFELVFVDDEEVLVETLGDLLYEDVDFILPGDGAGETTRRTEAAIRRLGRAKQFAWPPPGWNRHGGDPSWPFRTLVPLHSISFGDFLGQIYAAAKIAAKFQYSETTFLMHDVHPYQKSLIKFFPYPCKVAVAKTNRGFKNAFVSFYRQGQEFVFPTGYSSDKFVTEMGLGTLIVPSGLRHQADETLCRAGLDPDRWFCCLHFRQPNYRYKAVSNCRDVDPERYLKSIDYVIDDLGGQVVLLGHPEMTTRPARPGFVDLSRLPNNSVLQMCAVARSRFVCCSPTGGGTMAIVLGTPLGVTDHSDFWDIGAAAFMTHTLVKPDGTRLEGQTYFESGWMTTSRTGEKLADGTGFSLIKRSESDLRQAIDHMVRETREVLVWRNYREPTYGPENRFDWPFTIGLNPTFI